MARYIDADKVMEEINRIGGHNLCEWDTIGVKALIDRQQTADVVEVVRCKDCKHRVLPSKMCAHPKAIGWDAIEPEDDDFCSYGEKALKEREKE